MKVKKSRKLLIRYIIAGGISFGVELGFLLFIYKGLGLSGELSTAISYWIGFISAFFLQKLLTFKDYEKTMKNISKQLVTYCILVAFNYIFTIVFIAFTPDSKLIFARIVALLLTTTWNFILYKKVIFKTTRTTND